MKFAVVFRGVTLVGLLPTGVPPRKRQPTTPTGRGSTYQRRKPVQTKPATAICGSSSARNAPGTNLGQIPLTAVSDGAGHVSRSALPSLRGYW